MAGAPVRGDHWEEVDPWAPTASLGLQLDSGMQPLLSFAFEWTPARTFRRWPGGNETRVGTASGLAALEMVRQRPDGVRHGRGAVTPARRGDLERPNGRAVDYRDPTWSVTLGGDAMVRLYRGVSAVPYLRWDTDGGRLAYGSQVRSGIGIRAAF